MHAQLLCVVLVIAASTSSCAYDSPWLWGISKAGYRDTSWYFEGEGVGILLLPIPALCDIVLLPIELVHDGIVCH